MAEAGMRIAGLVGTMIDAMMTGVMTIGVTMTAVMTNGGTKAGRMGEVGWEVDAQMFQL